MKLFTFNRMISAFSFLIVLSLLPRPAYSIPKPIKSLCQKFNIDVCAGPPETVEEKSSQPKERQISDNERRVLTQLLEKQKELDLKEDDLERRESQLKMLHEDLQNQLLQLERLQKEVERGIEAKKSQDTEQLNRIVKLYEKMDPAKAGASIAKLDQKIAVKILMRLKEKQASQVLSQVDAAIAAKLIEEMAKK